MKNTPLRFVATATALAFIAALSFWAMPFRSTHAFAVTDAQIAAIVVAANTVDIEAGKLAQSKTKNKRVQAFADRMVKEHTGVQEAAVALVTKLGVTPEENDTSRGLLSDGEAARARMSKLSDKEFDQAYAANEVAYHKLVLNALDNTLLPGAQNAELKQMLVDVRPAFVAHLKHAEELRDSLSGKKSDKDSHTKH
jgi:putative membrane protein